MQFSLYLIAGAHGHIVAQVIEAKLIVGAESNIGVILTDFFRRRYGIANKTHGKSQKFVKFAHPLTIACGKVFINRNHMHAFARQGVQIYRAGGYQRFALAGAHLGNTAVMQRHAANQLHVKMAHTQNAAAGFTHYGIGFQHKIVNAGALRQAIFKIGRFGLQVIIA